LFVALALVGLAWIGARAGETKKGTAAVYKTPEEAFAALTRAADKADAAAVCATLTEESRDTFVAATLFGAAAIKEKLSGKEPDKDKLMQIDQVLTKYGINADAVKDVVAAMMEIKKDPGPATWNAGVRKASQFVKKDRCGFFGEMILLVSREKSGNPFELYRNARLEDLKVDGETAKATMVLKLKDAEVREPVELRKESGSWKVNLSLAMQSGKKSPPPSKEVKETPDRDK
jgi:hypothetical protein